MFNEEDLTVASLAKIVGTELTTIDKFTERTGGNNSPSNKIDPRAFLTKTSVRQSKGNVVTHDGKLFHAGVDESLVQSLYPDPVPASLSLPENVQSSPILSRQETPSSRQLTNTQSAVDTEILIKILQSIDKTLKSIDKTEKNIAKLLTKSSID